MISGYEKLVEKLKLSYRKRILNEILKKVPFFSHSQVGLKYPDMIIVMYTATDKNFLILLNIFKDILLKTNILLNNSFYLNSSTPKDTKNTDILYKMKIRILYKK